MAALRRKPRVPFPYVLKQDRALPEPEQPRFLITPPGARIFADVSGEATSDLARAMDVVIKFVERLENHADAAEFGGADSPQRTRYVEEIMGLDVIHELGNAVSAAMLTERELKNSASPSASGTPAGGEPAAASTLPT